MIKNLGETYLGGRSAILIILIIIVASGCIFTPLFFLILKFLIILLIVIQPITLTSSFNDKRLRLLLLLFNSFTLLPNPAFLIGIFWLLQDAQKLKVELVFQPSGAAPTVRCLPDLMATAVLAILAALAVGGVERVLQHEQVLLLLVLRVKVVVEVTGWIVDGVRWMWLMVLVVGLEESGLEGAATTAEQWVMQEWAADFLLLL